MEPRGPAPKASGCLFLAPQSLQSAPSSSIPASIPPTPSSRFHVLRFKYWGRVCGLLGYYQLSLIKSLEQLRPPKRKACRDESRRWSAPYGSFRLLGVPYFGVHIIKDPTIECTILILGFPIFGNSHTLVAYGGCTLKPKSPKERLKPLQKSQPLNLLTPKAPKKGSLKPQPDPARPRSLHSKDKPVVRTSKQLGSQP